MAKERTILRRCYLGYVADRRRRNLSLSSLCLHFLVDLVDLFFETGRPRLISHSYGQTPVPSGPQREHRVSVFCFLWVCTVILNIPCVQHDHGDEKCLPCCPVAPVYLRYRSLICSSKVMSWGSDIALWVCKKVIVRSQQSLYKLQVFTLLNGLQSGCRSPLASFPEAPFLCRSMKSKKVQVTCHIGDQDSSVICVTEYPKVVHEERYLDEKLLVSKYLILNVLKNVKAFWQIH